MSIKNVRPLGVNTMDGSWSVYRDEVSCIEVNLVLLYGFPKYNAQPVFTKYCRHCVFLFFVCTLVVLRNRLTVLTARQTTAAHLHSCYW
jgi:hypothetical protein